MAEVQIVGTPQYHLILSDKEASALLEVVGKITGPSNGPRGLVDKIYYALKNAGVRATFNTASGLIRFDRPMED